MSADRAKAWTPTTIVFFAGAIATALVPLTVPLLGPLTQEFNVDRHSLGWVVSFPTLVCALGALAFGVVVDRVGDIRTLLVGMALVILGDIGVSMAPTLQTLFGARLFQGFGYVCLTVAGPSFIQRTTGGDMRRAAMALWAAHTPVGFACAVYGGATLLAAGLSWRFSFLGHAVVAFLIGLLVVTLRKVRSEANFSRSAGTMRVLSSPRPYLVGIGAGAAGMLQVGIMVMLPGMLTTEFGFSGPQAALVVVAAMTANLLGAMLVVATKLRNLPSIALPISGCLAALFGFAVVGGMTVSVSALLFCVMVFSAAIGTANALVWSLLPAAVPSPEAAGATAGLITQGSFLGVLISPPTFFWIRHESPALIAALMIVLAVLLVAPLMTPRAAGGAPVVAH